MPNPLDALRKAQTIGADPHPPPHPEDDWLGTAVQGLLGTMGLGDSKSRANLGGQLLGAAVPFAGASERIPGIVKGSMVEDAMDQVGLRLKSGPTSIPFAKTGHAPTDALVDMLSQPPEPKDPLRVFAGEKVGGMVPPAPSYRPPRGFNILTSDTYMPTRGNGLQELRDQQMAQRTRFTIPDTPVQTARTPEDLQFINPIPARRPPPPLSGKWSGKNNGRNNTGLTEDQVREIRQLVNNGENLDWIGRQYNIKAPTVRGIAKRDTFSHVK